MMAATTTHLAGSASHADAPKAKAVGGAQTTRDYRGIKGPILTPF